MTDMIFMMNTLFTHNTTELCYLLRKFKFLGQIAVQYANIYVGQPGLVDSKHGTLPWWWQSPRFESHLAAVFSYWEEFT